VQYRAIFICGMVRSMSARYAPIRGWALSFYEGCGLGEQDRGLPPKQREVQRNPENLRYLEIVRNLNSRLPVMISF
jgi:hypothetical protein